MRNRADKKLQTDRRTDGQDDSYIPPNRVLGGIITECFTTQWRLLTPLRKEPFDLDRWHWYHRKGLTTRDIHTKYNSFLTYHSKVVANVKVFCVQIDREGKNYSIPGAPLYPYWAKKCFGHFSPFPTMFSKATLTGRVQRIHSSVQNFIKESERFEQWNVSAAPKFYMLPLLVLWLTIRFSVSIDIFFFQR